MKKVLMWALLILTISSLTGCSNSQYKEEADEAVSDYNEAAKSANQSVKAYNDAIDEMTALNAEFEEAIEQAQAVADTDGVPYDESTLDSLKNEIRTAGANEQEIPQPLSYYEELEEVPRGLKKEELEEITKDASDKLNDLKENPAPEAFELPDYTDEKNALETASKKYEASVEGYRQILTSDLDFISERLQQVSTITEAQTEGADEDDGKGYLGSVYFTDSQVDRFALYIRDEDVGAAEVGVKGGGSVELYDSEEDARARDEDLGIYDGTIFSNGAHQAFGSMVIRISDLLTTAQQVELTEEIEAALLKVAD